MEAKAFYEEHGNLHVPISYVEKNGSSLYTWIGKQKEEYLKSDHGMLSDTQVGLLEEIGKLVNFACLHSSHMFPLYPIAEIVLFLFWFSIIFIAGVASKVIIYA